MWKSFVLLVLSVHVSGTDVFLFTFGSEVGRGEFVYYKIIQSGNLLLLLDTIEGDADIYISSHTHSPNYQPDNYDLHSATCGIDKVFIPANMNRPIAVGIYGHSSMNSSKFRLEVYQTSGDEIEMLASQFPAENVMESEILEDKSKHSVPNKKKLRDQQFPNAMWRLLEIFEMFFL